MSFEQKINYQLNKYPAVKKVIKYFYQRAMYTISPKIKFQGNIIRISPDDLNHEYFFGYYDKSPWDITNRFMLCMKADNTWADVSPKETAEIILIDTEKLETDPKRIKKLAETRAWNVQQSCMLQWLGPDFSSRILYNDFRDGKYVAVILTLRTGEEQVIDAPVYSVSNDGKVALTLDFSRLYNLRPGYGYYNIREETENIGLPDATAIWMINLEENKVFPLLKYTDFANFHPRYEMKEEGSIHKVNHIMLSPNGKRFMVLYRWFCGKRKYTRLITCNVDGTDMYVLSDDDMVSHCCWKNDEEILAFENKQETGPGYYLMKDKTQEYIQCWPQFSNDGHPSYSPDGKYVVTDSYPDRARIASINIMRGSECNGDNTTIARVFAPFKYDNDTRCDLHPRWSRDGKKVCFDSVFEGHRGLYVVELSTEMLKDNFSDYEFKENVSFSIITPVYNSFLLMRRYFESLNNQSYKNFEVIFVDDCSTDGSYEQLLEYQKSTSLKMIVLKTEKNLGPGVARNIGMKAAKNEWITFFDNDDWVVTDFFEKVVREIKREKADCVICDYYTQRDSGTVFISHSVIGEHRGIIPTNRCIMGITNHTVCKVYRRDICVNNNVVFPQTRRCEDVAFTILAVSFCVNIYYMEQPLYYYYQRSGSLSNNAKLDEKDMVKAFTILQNKLESKYPKEIEEKSIRDLLYGCVLMMCKAGKSSKEIKEHINNYESKYPDWYKCKMVNKVGKAKKVFLFCIRYRQIAILRKLSAIHTKIVTG